MTTKEKATQLITAFGKDTSIKVVDELINRDRQWVENLTEDYPQYWSLSDFDKSLKLFNELKEKIEGISTL